MQTELGVAWAMQYKPGMRSDEAQAFKRGWSSALASVRAAVFDDTKGLPFDFPDDLAIVAAWIEQWAEDSLRGSSSREEA